MFDFFRRKPAQEPASAAPPPEDRGQDAASPDDRGAANAPFTGRAEADTPVASAPPPSSEATSGEATSREARPRRSWVERLRSGLGASRERLAGSMGAVFRRRVLDDEALEELESALLMADIGVTATHRLLDDLRERYRRAGAGADARELLRDSLRDLVTPLETNAPVADRHPTVIMLVGVNGAGKTTSIGKLARWLHLEHRSVLLAAGDTFRAAAREQLSAWGERNGVTVIQQQGGDPAAVMFDAVRAASARRIDVVLADTAGRLPTQLHLMDELKKIRRVLAKARDGAPDEVWLVLDANTGQNALAQVEAFDTAVGLTGLILTKLDGSARGGVVAAIAAQHPVPLRFIGVGEGIEDLQPFRAEEFVDALLPAVDIRLP